MQVANDVIAVFKQAAGANADQILKRIADYGVAGRKTALDADMFTSPGPLPLRQLGLFVASVLLLLSSLYNLSLHQNSWYLSQRFSRPQGPKRCAL